MRTQSVKLHHPYDVKNKTQYLGQYLGREYSKEEFYEIKKSCSLCLPIWLYIIGKGFFLEKILKLINVGKKYFNESLVTDTKY